MARVGIDLDGVCYDFAASLKHFLVEHEDMNPDRCTDPTRWEFYLDWGMTPGQFLSACGRGVNEGVVFLHGDPIDGVAEQLARLKVAGHTVHIITDRAFGTNNRAQSNTFAWLAKHGIPYDDVTFTADKTTVPVDYMIDDKVENYIALRDVGVCVMLLDRPWNQHGCDEAWRVTDLTTFVDEVLAVESHTLRLDALMAEPSIFEASGEIRSVSSTGGQKGVKPARHSLIPSYPQQLLAEHYARGAEKYDDHQWRKGYEWSKSYDAMQRHAQAWNDGQTHDPETGSNHMTCVAWHAFALLQFSRDFPEFDDRYKPERTETA